MLRASPHAEKPSRIWQPWAVLLLGLALTGAVWQQMDASVARHVRRDFAHLTWHIESTLRDRLEDYRLALHGSLALFSASRDVNRQEWHSYVAALNLTNNLPGILGMGYAKFLLPRQLEAHVRQVRAEGFPAYRVWPAGTRPAYTSIVYLEPFSETNQRAFGYDMYSEPVRRAAMDRARDSGLPSISGRVHLQQEGSDGQQAGFLMYIPHYAKTTPPDSRAARRASLLGWVYAPFRMDDLMRSAFGRSLDNEVGISIHDGGGTEERNLLYRSGGNGPAPLSVAREPLARAEFQIEFGGRVWTVRLHSLPGYEARIDRQKPRLALAAGLVISLLLFALTRNLASTRTRAEALAGEMTRALGDSENRYRQMFETNRAVKLIIDPEDGRIVHANPAAEDFYGYPLSRLVTMRISDINTMPPEDVKAEMARAKVQNRLYFNFRHRLASGALRHVEVYSGPVKERERTLLYSVIHDVTALHQTLAEQRAILDNAVCGITHLRNRHFVWVNPKFEQMFGYRAEEVAGQPTRLVYASQEDADRVGAEGYDTLVRGEHYQTECQMRRKDGSIIWVALSGKLLDPADPAGGSIWVLLDASDAHAAREALLTRSQALRELSLRDPLTGLHNRRHLDEALAREAQVARRKSRSLAAIMLDIDHFKRFNDTFGHEAGDEVLRAVAQLLAREVRESDIACRYGGEEFLLLLPETALAVALERAENLRRAVANLDLRHQGRPLGRITISLGVAELPGHARDGEALVAAADAALYQAKHAGRDRVASGPAAPP